MDSLTSIWRMVVVVVVMFVVGVGVGESTRRAKIAALVLLQLDPVPHMDRDPGDLDGCSILLCCS